MTDLSTTHPDLPEGEPRHRAAALQVAAKHLAELRPFRSAASLFRSTTSTSQGDDAAPDASEASIALVDVAEWILTGEHPLDSYDGDPSGTDSTGHAEKPDGPLCILCGKRHENPVTLGSPGGGRYA